MEIKTYLQNLEISFKPFTYPAVFTCEEAEEHFKPIRGVHSKSLFIKDRKSRRFYLVILPFEKKANLKALANELKDKQLKFASEENLKEILALLPGCVSPAGLINDQEHKVKVVIDKEVWDSEFASFHSNENIETLELKKEDFHKFINSLENELKIVEKVI